MKNITVKIENHFGNDVIVPVCVNAQTFAKLVNNATLSKETIKHIQSLGYAVNIKQKIVSLHDVMESA